MGDRPASPATTRRNQEEFRQKREATKKKLLSEIKRQEEEFIRSLSVSKDDERRQNIEKFKKNAERRRREMYELHDEMVSWPTTDFLSEMLNWLGKEEDTILSPVLSYDHIRRQQVAKFKEIAEQRTLEMMRKYDQQTEEALYSMTRMTKQDDAWCLMM